MPVHATLDLTGKIPTSNLGDGIIDGKTYLKDTRVWVPVPNRFTTVYKTTTEIRTSTTTLTSDASLTLPLLSGILYTIRCYMHLFTENGDMDYKYATTFSGTTSDPVYSFSYHIAAGYSGSGENANTFVGQIPSTNVLGGNPGGLARVYVEQFIKPNSNGTWAIQWAQRTSDTDQIRCLAGSYIQYMEVI